jgi:hypothetical protein
LCAEATDTASGKSWGLEAPNRSHVVATAWAWFRPQEGCWVKRRTPHFVGPQRGPAARVREMQRDSEVDAGAHR